MGYPNQNCGECSYWLAFGEPETTEEENEKIIEHCKHCTHSCGIVDVFGRKLNNGEEISCM